LSHESAAFVDISLVTAGFTFIFDDMCHRL
jgi:hypothetical protein